MPTNTFTFISLQKLNQDIRDYIVNYVYQHPNCETRTITQNGAKIFSTPAQRIAGNVSFLVVSNTLQIDRDYPHSRLSA